MDRQYSVRKAGRHFLQIPGPTNVPDRILRAISRPTIDHRGPEFSKLGKACLQGMKRIFQTTKGQVFIYPSSGTGAWEAAIVNTLSPGDRVLMFETGQFGTLWKRIAEKFGLLVDFVPGDWRHGVSPATVESKLLADIRHEVKAGAFLAALAYSAPTLASWADSWTHKGHGLSAHLKAWGFTILLEGTMVLSHLKALSLSGLVILVAFQMAA